MPLFRPADGPPWLRQFADSVERLFREKLTRPLWLWSAATADLPTTPELGANEGAILYNTSLDKITSYDGSAWQTYAYTSHTHTEADITLGATDRLVGRDTAGAGAAEEISVGGGIEFTGAGGIQTSAFTGDVTKAAGGTALTLATVNSNVGTFGSATQVAQVTLDGKGRATAAANVTITPAASSITGGAALSRTDDTNVTLTLGGTPADALLKAVSLTLGWTGTLAVTRGGTGAANASDARTNLGLGTAATKNTGTSGNTVSLLDGANTWSAAQTISAALKQTGTIPVRIENNDSAAASGTGQGMELAGADGVGNSIVRAYNRTTSAYGPLCMDGATVALRPSGTVALTIDGTYGNFANDAAAAAGGVPVKGIYRNGSVLMVRVA